jgi:hypothetical protein
MTHSLVVCMCTRGLVVCMNTHVLVVCMNTCVFVWGSRLIAYARWFIRMYVYVPACTQTRLGASMHAY